MNDFIAEHGLDLLTTLLGLIYLVLEYKAHIALWIVGIVMPALDILLYYQHGLYGDAFLAVYYTVAAIYGYAVWRIGRGNNEPLPITHMKWRGIPTVAASAVVVWAVTYYILTNYTNSTVPGLDAFTNALSIVGLWALSRKYVEQWLFWLVVDVVCCYLYVEKQIPFKAALYGLYVVIAVAGYMRWHREAKHVKTDRMHLGDIMG